MRSQILDVLIPGSEFLNSIVTTEIGIELSRDVLVTIKRSINPTYL